MNEYKGYQIVGDGKFAMKVIKQIGSGPVPTSLKGLYSSTETAYKAIDLFLASQPKPRKQKNGKTEVRSTD